MNAETDFFLLQTRRQIEEKMRNSFPGEGSMHSFSEKLFSFSYNAFVIRISHIEIALSTGFSEKQGFPFDDFLITQA